MHRLAASIKSDWPAYLVIIIGFAGCVALAMAPLSFLISNLVPDDAFYYFEIARNIVHGLGSTFDGVNPTNGYHPLWLLLLLPIFSFFSSSVAPIHATLLLSAILNGLFGIVLLRILSRYTNNPWIKAAALGVWFFNPFNVYEMLSGLETPLSLFFIALFLLCAIRVQENGTRGRLIFAGIVGGLMILARLDDVLYLVLFLAWLLYRHRNRGTVSRILTAGVAAAIIVAPWLVWNFAHFDMFLTSSSEGTAIVNHQLIVQDHGPSIMQTIKATVYSIDYYMRMMMGQTGAPSMFFVLAGACMSWCVFEKEKVKKFFADVPVEWFFFAAFAVDFIIDAGVRWVGRTWYFVPFNLFVALLVAWYLERLRQKGNFPRKTVAAVLALTFVIFGSNWSKDVRDRQSGQAAIYASALWMNSNLPPGATIGAFDAGIQGYFSTDRVINLDGLVNNAALNALEQKDLWNYIQSAHIQYLADVPDTFSYRYESFFGVPDIFSYLKPIDAVTQDGSEVDIYQVQ